MSTNTDPKTNKPRKFVVVVPELFLETKESLSQLKAQRKEQQKLLQKQKLIQIREKRKRKSQNKRKHRQDRKHLVKNINYTSSSSRFKQEIRK